MGCFPPYWRNILGTSSSLTECRSPEQLSRLHDLTKDYKKIWEGRNVPCIDMFHSAMPAVGVQNDVNICKKCVYFEIMYVDQYYEEITEIKDFGFEDFISNIGGFIGIFLGYSMMQIPHLLGMPVH